MTLLPRNRTLFALAMTCLAAVGCFVAASPTAAVETAAPPKVRTRNIARKAIEQKIAAGTELIGLEFEVLATDAAGDHVSVDAEKHSFAIGDSFVVKIRPQDDVYVYIFTEGPPPDSERSRLLPHPDKDESAKFVRHGEEVTLPEADDVFTFEPPAGEEKLVVVASKKPVENLEWLAGKAFEEKGRTMNSVEAEQQENAKKGYDALRARSASVVRTRAAGLEIYRALESASPKDLSNQEIVKEFSDDSKVTEVVRTGAGEIIVDIPLRSRHHPARSN